MNRIVLSLLVLGVTACGITDADNITLRVEGTVTAIATGEPVSGATVRLIDIAEELLGGGGGLGTTTTDAQGRYSLSVGVGDNCRDGFVLGVGVDTQASGYRRDSREIGCHGALQRVDIPLEPE